MKQLIMRAWVTAAAATMLCSGNAKAELVYDNSLYYLGQDFNPGTNQVGDEITLAGSLRTLSLFRFEYFALDVPSDQVTVQLRFFALDTQVNSQGFYGPGNLLFDSGAFNVPETPYNTIGISDFSDMGYATPLNSDVPDTFIWTVAFSNFGSGTSGLRLYDPPTVGSSQTDYWYFDSTAGWLAKTNTNPDINMSFGALVEAVPEPTVTMLGLAGGLALLALKLRSNSRRS